MRNLLAVLAFLCAGAAVASPRICIYNGTNEDLVWTLKSRTGQLIVERSPHDFRAQWVCEPVDKATEHELRAFPAVGHYDMPGCHISKLRYSDTVEIVRGDKDASNPFKCIHRPGNRGGVEPPKDFVEDVQYKTYAEDSGYVVRGIARYINPLVEATVQVRDLSGRLIKEFKRATSKTGTFTVKVSEAPADGFRIDVVADRKTVSAIFSDFDYANQIAHVNVATTLAAELSEKRRTDSVADIQERVRRYLGVGSAIRLGEDLGNPLQNVFSAVAFDEAASREGGYDSLMREVVDQMDRDDRATRPFTKRLLRDMNPIVKWAGEKAAGGIISSLAGMGLNELIGLMGTPNTDQQQLLNAFRVLDARITEILNSILDLQKLIKMDSVSRRAEKIEDGIRRLRTKKDKADWWRDEINAGRSLTANDVTNLKNDITELKRRAKEEIPDVMDLIHDSLTKDASDAGVVPLTSMWADAILPKVAGKQNFIDRLWGQLEYYRTQEVYLLGLWKGVHDGDGEFASGRYAVTVYERNKKDEQPHLGSHPVMKKIAASSTLKPAFFDSKIIVEVKPGRVWSTSLLPKLADYKEADALNSGSGFKNANYVQTTELFAGIGESTGVTFPASAVLQSIGFSKADTDKAKLVYQCCTVPRFMMLNWFLMNSSPQGKFIAYPSWVRANSNMKMDGVYILRYLTP